jgi:hypothetical protein
MGAFARADDINLFRVRHICRFLHSVAPLGCYGSRAKYDRWVESGGLNQTQENDDA